MKILLSLLLLGAGAGWYGLVPRTATDGTDPLDACVPAECPLPCDPGGCDVTVEPTPAGTCLVTCRDEDGGIVCQEEISCDRPGERPCTASSEESCAPGACNRSR